MHPVFIYRHLRIKRRCKKTLCPLHPLQGAHLRIAALINAPDFDAVLLHKTDQGGQDFPFKPVNPKCQRLHHQDICELVHHKPRQKIRLAENYAAARCIHRSFPIFPGIPHTRGKKSIIHPLLFPAAHHTHADF